MHLKTVALKNPVTIAWRNASQQPEHIHIQHLLPVLDSSTKFASVATTMLDLARAIGQEDVEISRGKSRSGNQTPLATYRVINALSHLPGNSELWVLLDFDPQTGTLSVQSFGDFRRSPRFRTRSTESRALTTTATELGRQRNIYLTVALIVGAAAGIAGLGWVFMRLVDGWIVS